MNGVDFLRTLVHALAEREPDSKQIAHLEQRAEQAEEDRDCLEAQARGWKALFETAINERDNEFARAEEAKAEVEVKDQRIADVRDYWKNDREQLQAEKEKADATRERATRMMIQTTSRAKRAENRAAAWWDTAKTLCRQRDICNNAASEGWYRAFQYRERAEKAESLRNEF